MAAPNDNGHHVVAVNVDSAGGLGSTNCKSDSTSDSAVLQSRSTSTEAQRAKLLAMLKVKPQTTIELRDSGIMMPAARVFELKRIGHIIRREIITQYDANGYLHPRCARYSLVTEAV